MQGFINYLRNNYQRVVEVGVGAYPRVAQALIDAGLRVIAVDIRPRFLPFPVEADDITSPRLELYHEAQAIYAVRPPGEMIPHLRRLAAAVCADLIIKPLAGEPSGGRLINQSGDFFYLFSFAGASLSNRDQDHGSA